MAEIKTEPLTDYYEVKEELGRGRFAVVKRCIKILTGEIFAAKCIRKARAGRRGREQLLLEIDIFAAGGDLHKHCLEQIDAVCTEKEICYLVYQIIEAAKYLHENNVVHLDLKPENILLKNDERFPEIRLIDFGLSRRVDLPYSQYDIVGTPEYVAPEVLAYEPIELSADLWSIGVVTYVLLSGISPFAGDDVMQTYSNIANVDFDFDAEEFDDISEEAKDFIECLLIKDSKERLKIQECLEHPWLQQMEKGIKEEDIIASIKAEEAFNKQVGVDDANEGAEVFSEGLDNEAKLNDEHEHRVESEKAITDHTDKVVIDGEDVESIAEANSKEESKPKSIEVMKNGVFDIDSLISKDDAEEEPLVTNSVCYEERESCSETLSSDASKEDNMDIATGFSSGEDKGLDNEGSGEILIDNNNSIDAKKTTVSHADNLIRNDSEEVSEITAVMSEKSVSKENRLVVEKNVVDSGREISDELVGVGSGALQTECTRNSYRKQKSSNEAFNGKDTAINHNVASSSEARSSGASLLKMKSVDENLLLGRRKGSSDNGKNKLTAQLEKLSKAGMNFNSNNDIRKAMPAVIRQGSAKRENSPEKIVLDSTPTTARDFQLGDMQRKGSQGSRSSGSRTPTSGRGTPDSGRGTPTGGLQVTTAPTASATKDAKTTSLGKQTSEEKSAFAKRPAASKTPLGVRQGIAAQMASKFANTEKKDSPTATTVGKLNKPPSPKQQKVPMKKSLENHSQGTRTPESALSQSPQMSPIFNRAQRFVNPPVADENDNKRPVHDSPKFDRSTKFSDLQRKVKEATEQKPVAVEVCSKESKLRGAHIPANNHAQENKQRSATTKKDVDDVDGVKKTTKGNEKEHIRQKFEGMGKANLEGENHANKVKVQPKGLQINLNLQASDNKFKAKDITVPLQREASPNKWEAKLSSDKPLKFNFGDFDTSKQGNISVTTQPLSSILDEDHDLNHVEHTAIGAVARTAPRVPLRELRGKSRTSRGDRGDGSPSSPRKSYRRLYVTHVKGSKSEQDDDVAEFKTKVEKDELKVELLVKFPDIKFGTL
eukprot:gene2975-3429_t